MKIEFTTNKGEHYYCLKNDDGNIVYYDMVSPEIIERYRDEYTKYLKIYQEKLMNTIEEILKDFDNCNCCDFG